jgi:hypothetical protein
MINRMILTKIVYHMKHFIEIERERERVCPNTYYIVRNIDNYF